VEGWKRHEEEGKSSETRTQDEEEQIREFGTATENDGYASIRTPQTANMQSVREATQETFSAEMLVDLSRTRSDIDMIALPFLW